ncbi:SPRY domain containing protein [Nitzschia inconspicua]|uniref:SPRY domain containing protein n=1 Tax=Nitzschia inconspicua TaxID=303405 RepID=A0A9K3KWI9_9STRA|nr:SPRY domain containing protein [Nitzschia inconspicua]
MEDMDVEDTTTNVNLPEDGETKTEAVGLEGDDEVPESAPQDVVKENSEGTTAADDPVTPATMPTLAGKKRSRVGGDDVDASSTANVSAASAAAASQLSSSIGLLTLGSLLSASVALGGSSSNSNNSSVLPTIDQVQQQSIKNSIDSPPYLHLSKTDSAPQLKMGPDRLSVKGGMRGYRMTRASQGVPPAGGNYYYEVVIQEPPSIQEIINSLPTNVRISKKLQQEMQQALKLEEQRKEQAKAVADKSEKMADDENTAAESSTKTETTNVSGFGSHVRLGWSMRTGDLQAPVGYDKWSYGVRDIGGSKIHCSKREDHWGGEEFGPGDVVGCAISMVPDSTMEGVGAATRDKGSSGSLSHQQHQAQLQQPLPNHNHIRFFKNGYPMGEFIISKGKREGGAAFIIPDGVYYPAISLYMGANVKVNFGPNFIYQPRKLPTGLKLQPMSNLCSPPISTEDATAKIAKEKPFRKPDMHQKFLELVQTEVQVLQDAYKAHRTQHILFVLEERKKRALKTDDLESDAFFLPSMKGEEMPSQ